MVSRLEGHGGHSCAGHLQTREAQVGKPCQRVHALPGTDQVAAKAVCSSGLATIFVGVSTGTLYGDGTYFADSSTGDTKGETQRTPSTCTWMTTPQRQGLTLAGTAQLSDPDGNAPAILAAEGVKQNATGVAFVDRFRLPELLHRLPGSLTPRSFWV